MARSGTEAGTATGAGAATRLRRNTRQKELIAHVMSDLDSFETAQSIHERLTSRGERVGIATVYRNLQAMAEAGQVDTLRQGNETLYRVCADQDHHHHLVCRSCGRTVEFEIPGLEDWVAAAARRNGFTAVTHTVEVFGLCPSCAAAQGGRESRA